MPSKIATKTAVMMTTVPIPPESQSTEAPAASGNAPAIVNNRPASESRKGSIVASCVVRSRTRAGAREFFAGFESGLRDRADEAFARAAQEVRGLARSGSLGPS